MSALACNRQSRITSRGKSAKAIRLVEVKIIPAVRPEAAPDHARVVNWELHLLTTGLFRAKRNHRVDGKGPTRRNHASECGY
jgi:hypothetical protein